MTVMVFVEILSCNHKFNKDKGYSENEQGMERHKFDIYIRLIKLMPIELKITLFGNCRIAII
jgi:hypothetical protein